jgi:hypothetical protein
MEPVLHRAVSTLEMGAAVDMTLVNYAVRRAAVPNCEYICALIRNALISWEMKHSEAWPYPARRDQVIEATGPDSCRYFRPMPFSGANGIHVYRFAGPWVKRGL